MEKLGVGNDKKLKTKGKRAVVQRLAAFRSIDTLYTSAPLHGPSGEIC